MFVVDQTGFPKRGNGSVGVARQYCGAVGNIANCQAGVFLAYASSKGRALVDARLYLPEAWAEDRERRAARVPGEVELRTKAELAVEMLHSARENGHLPCPCVTGDENYGQVPAFRDALDGEGWRYVLEVPTTARVFLGPPAREVPARRGDGRPFTRRRSSPTAPSPGRWREVAASLADDA